MKIEMVDWSGGEIPVPRGTRVLVMHRDGEFHIAPAGVEHCGAYDWSHTNDKGDIVACLIAEELP